MSADEIDIVIVEDNPNDAELIMRVLKKHGLANRLVVLRDGVEAIEFLFAEGKHAGRAVGAPRVILLDLKLPKVDGIEVLRRLKSDERTRQLPVVVLTSSTEDRDLKAAYELGVNSYVTKPIKFDEFARLIADLGMYWMVVNRLSGR